MFLIPPLPEWNSFFKLQEFSTNNKAVLLMGLVISVYFTPGTVATFSHLWERTCYSLPGMRSFVSGSWSAFWSAQKSNIKNKYHFNRRMRRDMKVKLKCQFHGWDCRIHQTGFQLAFIRSPVWLFVSLPNVSCSTKSPASSIGAV